MHAIAVINRDGGAVRSLNQDEYCSHVSRVFREHGHSVECRVVGGDGLIAAIEGAAEDGSADILIASGGDGTASATARAAIDADKIFGLIPTGTLNLFARSLGLSLDPYVAVEALAGAEVKRCDVASANGEIYIHQFSIGTQPRLIDRRKDMDYSGKIGKLFASLKATTSVLFDDVTYDIKISEMPAREFKQTNLLTVSNNPYGEGHLPFADRLNTGLLGVYWAEHMTTTDEMMLVSDILTGQWEKNPDLNHVACEEVTIEIRNLATDSVASIDGELVPLEETTKLRILPGKLEVLVPSLKDAN